MEVIKLKGINGQGEHRLSITIYNISIQLKNRSLTEYSKCDVTFVNIVNAKQSRKHTKSAEIPTFSANTW